MNKDVLSDSDPEGDRLDVQEILKNCNNPTINKKIKASYSTPVVPAQNLKKVKRKALNSSAMKLQNRSIRLSCPPQF